MGIYVEIPICGSIEELWEKSQNPALHERWDLRFSQIKYLPRAVDEAQKFLYRTRIGFGVKIDGEGESSGSKNDDSGARTSSLRFWSDDQKSLIRSGSGYWKYIPDGPHIRFLTWYDYETRFGGLGKIIDRIFFRPILGWATAWSFDRLRLWIEQGITPEVSRERTIIYLAARGTVAFIWCYHGLVPKLLYHDPIELDMLSKVGTPALHLHEALNFAGGVEILVAGLLLIFWRHRWPLWFTVGFMLLGLPVVALTAPTYLTAAFNPLTLNLAVAALSMTAIITGRYLPTSTRCLREPNS
jgi:hypothetical protein